MHTLVDLGDHSIFNPCMRLDGCTLRWYGVLNFPMDRGVVGYADVPVPVTLTSHHAVELNRILKYSLGTNNDRLCPSLPTL